MAIDILESKVVGTNKETWYKLIGTKDDTKPTGEFPAGSGHIVAPNSRFFEVGTEIIYEFDGFNWIAKGQESPRLPNVTTDDNGKVLTVIEGEWDKSDAPLELPSVTSEDNGDVLTVVEGVWSKATLNVGVVTKRYAVTWVSEDHLTLQNNKKISDIIADINAGNDVIVFLGTKCYRFADKNETWLVFSYINSTPNNSPTTITYATIIFNVNSPDNNFGKSVSKTLTFSS